MTPHTTTTTRPHARSSRRPHTRPQAESADGRTRDEYAELVRCHQQAMYRYALRRLRSEQDALDVTQEALIAAWRFRHQRDTAMPARAWLLRITHNKLVDHLRRRRNELVIDADAEHGDPCCGDFTAPLAERMRLTAALAQLPPHHRNVVVLRLLQGLSEADTGDRLGLPQNTVKTRLHRARHQLAVLLAEQGNAA
jgi:RNA polymerase sigma-70 factor (ECF subfamily)